MYEVTTSTLYFGSYYEVHIKWQVSYVHAYMYACLFTVNYMYMYVGDCLTSRPKGREGGRGSEKGKKMEDEEYSNCHGNQDGLTTPLTDSL